MSKTRHLDAAIAILKKPRTPRASGTVISIYDFGPAGASVQVNHKEVWLAPNMERAREDAQRRKASMEGLGRTVIMQEFM